MMYKYSRISMYAAFLLLVSTITTLDLVNAQSDPPSEVPSSKPSLSPSDKPSSKPSSGPSTSPSEVPSVKPSLSPSDKPSSKPSSGPSTSPSEVPSSKPSLSPSDKPSLKPSSLPSPLPSDVPSSFPSLSPSDKPSSKPSMVPSIPLTEVPSAKPSLTAVPSSSSKPSGGFSTSPSEVPSSKPSVGKPKVNIKIAMAVSLDVENPPTSDEDRAEFAAVNEAALSKSAGDEKVEVVSIGGALLPVVLRTTLAPVKVDFNVILDLVCEGGDCAAALAGAAAAAEAVTNEISTSMSDGSFADNLKASAASLEVESLKNVSVDANSFSSEDPEITESGGGDSPESESESESFFEMILQFLADILDFLIPF